MKSIQKLNCKLQKINEIEKYISDCEYVDKIPVLKFMQYKLNMKRKDKVIKEIELVKRFAKGSKLLYEYDTNNWINDLNINCRKYCRMERRAKYKRDLKLYKCGYKSKRPISPMIQNIQRAKVLVSNFFKKVNKRVIDKVQKNNYEDQARKFRESLRIQPNNKIEVYRNTENSNRKITMKSKKLAMEYDI